MLTELQRKEQEKQTHIKTKYLEIQNYSNLSVGIAYTVRRENHGTMILHGVSYSAYTLRYGSYCRYEIAPSSQSFA